MTTTTNTPATVTTGPPEPAFTWDAIWTQAQSLATDLSAAGSSWQHLTGRLDALAGDWGALLLADPAACRHQSALVQLLGDVGGKGVPGRETVRDYLKAGAEEVSRQHKAALRADRAAERAAAAATGEPPPPEYRVSPGTSEPIELAAASALLAELPGQLAYRAGTFWRYDPAAGYWSPADEVTMQAAALGILQRCFVETEEGGALFRFGGAKEQANTIATLRPLAGAGPLDRATPPRVIVFNGGTYDLETGQLVPHSPDHGATFAVDAPWLGLQEHPPAEVLAFVAACYGIDALPIVRALVRWAMDPSIRYGQAWHLLGQSHSGKGLLLALLASLFPASLTSALPHPVLLENPDKVQQYCVGHRLVTFPDTPPRAPRNTSGHLGTWYSLVSNEPVTSRRLNASEVTNGRLHVRSIICSTTQLQLSDGRDGYLSRVLTLPTLPRTGAVDPTIKDRLLGDTDAHRTMRGLLAGWALAMPLEEVEAVLSRDDPAGILREAAADLAREADHPSRWADECLMPHPCGPQAPVNDQGWREFFDCYLLWCKRENIRHEGNRERFIGQIRAVLGVARCLPRGKGPRPAEPGAKRRDLPRFDAGFALRPGLVEGAHSWDEPRLVESKLQPGGLAALEALEPARRPDEPGDGAGLDP
jgi:hypothetical protein